MSVTRREILDAVQGTFGDGRVDRSALLAAAVERGARPAVIATLEGLPDREYGDVRDLWVELPEVPVGA